MTDKSNRREFCRRFAGATGWAMAGSRDWASSALRNSALPQVDHHQGDSPEDTEANLLTNPKYQIGAKLRLAQFIRKGADATKSRSDFPQPARFGGAAMGRRPCEEQGTEFAAQGDHENAKAAYEKASLYYGIAKFPVLNHPAKQAAYKKCIETYLKAAVYFDPPLERVTIPIRRPRNHRLPAAAQGSKAPGRGHCNRRY